MPKSNRMRSRSRSRSRRGGLSLDDLNPFGSSSATDSSSATGSNWYDNLNPFGKKSESSLSYTPPVMNQSTDMNPGYGGKRRRMCGGYSSNMSLTNLASSAAPISGVQTASSSFVGGKTRRRRHRHTKSCKKSCRKR